MATDINLNQPQTEQAERTRAGRFYRPQVDILESKDELVLVADLPGVKSDAIDIHFEEGVLTVHGSVAPRYEEHRQLLLGEYGIGDFERTFSVSEQIDANRIHAQYTAGVLTVHLPKTEAAKPRKIPVQTAG